MFEVSELTEKARTDSTGRPGDPDSKFLKNAKVRFDSQNIVFDSKNTIFAIQSSFENRKRCCRRSKISFNQCVHYCRMPGVIRQRHLFFVFDELEHFFM